MTQNRYQLFGPPKCPKPCAECPDENHHWLDHFDEEHAAFRIHGLLIWHACKHCNAWSPDIEGEVWL